MAKPILKFRINVQSPEVGGKLYGICVDNPVTPEVSIAQICEFKKITAFAPEQVLRLVEDVCDGACQLVARDGQSRQISTLLKFSPRIRGTFDEVNAKFTDQKLIVGARLLKDIKLDMDPTKFQIQNVLEPTDGTAVEGFFPAGWTGGYSYNAIRAAAVAGTTYASLQISGRGFTDDLKLSFIRHCRKDGTVLSNTPVGPITGTLPCFNENLVGIGENVASAEWFRTGAEPIKDYFTTGALFPSYSVGQWIEGDYVELGLVGSDETVYSKKIEITLD